MGEETQKPLTTAQAAAALGVEQQTVKKYCQAGTFPNAYKLGRDWLIPDGDLALVTTGGRKPGPKLSIKKDSEITAK